MSGEHSTSRGILNLPALLSLMLGNVVMTLNQVNISSIFTFGPLSRVQSISSEFGLSVYGLGVLTSVFFLAYGTFEVPGGVFAARIGPRRIVIYGIAANSLGVLGSALAPQFDALVIFRFIAGFGFAFSFPSTLVLMVRYYKMGSEGLGVALMAVATATGSVIGYFGWATIGAATGWRSALLIAAALDVVAAVSMMVAIPPDKVHPDFRLKVGHLRDVISKRALAALSVSLFGIASSFGLVSNFMIYYLEGNFGLAPSVAGSIASLSAVMPLFSAPIAGRLYDRVRNVRLLMLVPAAVVTAGVVIAAIDSVYAALLSVSIVGLSSGMVFTVGLASARSVASSNPEYESLTVAWVDSFCLFGVSLSPLYFSALVVGAGYPIAWVVGGSVSVLMTLPILAVRNESLRSSVTKYVTA